MTAPFDTALKLFGEADFEGKIVGAFQTGQSITGPSTPIPPQPGSALANSAIVML